MRQKYILRMSGTDPKSRPTLGLVYIPPSINGGIRPGVVVVGGPDRFRQHMMEVLDTVKACCGKRDDPRRVHRQGSREHWGQNAKSRWLLEDVAVREWDVAMPLIRALGWSMEQVTRMRRLMW